MHNDWQAVVHAVQHKNNVHSDDALSAEIEYLQRQVDELHKILKERCSQPKDMPKNQSVILSIGVRTQPIIRLR